MDRIPTLRPTMYETRTTARTYFVFKRAVRVAGRNSGAGTKCKPEPCLVVVRPMDGGGICGQKTEIAETQLRRVTPIGVGE